MNKEKKKKTSVPMPVSSLTCFGGGNSCESSNELDICSIQVPGFTVDDDGCDDLEPEEPARKRRISTRKVSKGLSLNCDPSKVDASKCLLKRCVFLF